MCVRVCTRMCVLGCVRVSVKGADTLTKTGSGCIRTESLDLFVS